MLMLTEQERKLKQVCFGAPWPHPGKTFQGEYRPVLNKKDFVRRYSYGEFGNCSPTWNSLQEFECYAFPTFGDVVDGFYHLRNRNVAGETYYNCTPLDVVMLWRHDVKDKTDWYCSAMAPTELTLINGEVMQGVNGLELFYSTVKKPMRDSLKEGGKQVYGVVASKILQHFMNAKSWDWLQVLLDRYQFHVVEFSCYDINWGTEIGYNTCFWEIRYGY